MFFNKTEFGTFQVKLEGQYCNLYLIDDITEIKIGYIKNYSLAVPDGYLVIKELMFRFMEIYLEILRTEAKYQRFINIPTENKFKDAFLRMRIEDNGQTYEVRKFIEEYNKLHTWITYPEYSQFFDLDAMLLESDFCFITPYSRYHIERTEERRAVLHKIKSDADSILCELYVPYDDPYDDISGTLYRHSMRIIATDTFDIMNSKFIEISKKVAESIKYMFGVDKLRMALRKRGLSDS